MRILTPLLLITLAASTTAAQSLFLDEGDTGTLLLGGYHHSESADGALAYYGASIRGEADVAVQYNRVWRPDGRTSWGVAPGAELFIFEMGRVPGALRMSVTIAAEFGKISGSEYIDPYAPGDPVRDLENSTYRALQGAARLYGRLEPEGRAFMYFGIAYVDLEIKTDHGDWTQTLSGSSKPVHFGVAAALDRWVSDVRVEHASGSTAFTVTFGRLL